METLPTGTPLTPDGWRQIPRAIFQDFYDRAGQYRTVNIARGSAMFCLVPHIAGQMEQRFAAIHAENALRNPTREKFARRAAEHICELNAIHPFRQRNRRTPRAFLERLAAAAGHGVDLKLIDPELWNGASVSSFQEATYDAMRQLILGAIVAPRRKRPSQRPRGQGRRR
jgi:cell filamentation protein